MARCTGRSTNRGSEKPSNKSAPGEGQDGSRGCEAHVDPGSPPSREALSELDTIHTHGRQLGGLPSPNPKPGKPDYSKARAYRFIALLNSLGKVVEKVAADIIADSHDQMAATRENQEQWKDKWPYDRSYPQPYQGPDASLHRGQNGCRKEGHALTR